MNRRALGNRGQPIRLGPRAARTQGEPWGGAGERLAPRGRARARSKRQAAASARFGTRAVWRAQARRRPRGGAPAAERLPKALSAPQSRPAAQGRSPAGGLAVRSTRPGGRGECRVQLGRAIRGAVSKQTMDSTDEGMVWCRLGPGATRSACARARGARRRGCALKRRRMSDGKESRAAARAGAAPRGVRRALRALRRAHARGPPAKQGEGPQQRGPAGSARARARQRRAPHPC